jgi:hypothetical protein
MSSVKVCLSFGKQHHEVELLSRENSNTTSFEALQSTLATLTGVPPSQQKIIAKGGTLVREHNISQIIHQLQSNSANINNTISSPKWMLLRTGPSPLGESHSSILTAQPVRIPIFTVNESQTTISGEPVEAEAEANAPSASSSPTLPRTPSSCSSSGVKILCCEPSDEWWDPFYHSDLHWWQPTVDVVETPEQVIVYAELPGLSKDKFVVNLHEEHLFISGTKYLKNFQRRVVLPSSVKSLRDIEIHSEYADGLLTIHLAKIA